MRGDYVVCSIPFQDSSGALLQSEGYLGGGVRGEDEGEVGVGGGVLRTAQLSTSNLEGRGTGLNMTIQSTTQQNNIHFLPRTVTYMYISLEGYLKRCISELIW